jgi:hypothetical protein
MDHVLGHVVRRGMEAGVYHAKSGGDHKIVIPGWGIALLSVTFVGLISVMFMVRSPRCPARRWGRTNQCASLDLIHIRPTHSGIDYG